MFTLIKREIQDHLLYLIGSIILAAILIIIMLSFAFQSGTQIDWDDLIAPVIPFTIVILLGFCAMGVSQMFTDRNKRTSAFVSTLPVTRTQILFARMIAGTLTILILFIPVLVTIVVLISWFALPIPMFSGIVFDISLTTFLMIFACYCVGLQSGWNQSKVAPTIGALGLTCFLLTLYLIKGFGWEIVAILIVFIAASLIRTWQTFTSTSL